MTNFLFGKDPFFNLFDDIDFDQLRPERLLSLNDKVQRYPLTNLGRDKDNNLVVEIACAGFSLNELSIQTEDNMIIINGHHEEKTSDVKYIQEHISSTDFTRKIYMIPLYVGGQITASLNNGILTIVVKPVEEKKPKTISISEGLPYKKQEQLEDKTKEEVIEQ
jgi:HSP20 family molecular chaperone IbpA